MTTPMQIVKELRKKYPDKHVSVDVSYSIYKLGKKTIRYHLYIEDTIDTSNTKGTKEVFINIVKDYLR